MPRMWYCSFGLVCFIAFYSVCVRAQVSARGDLDRAVDGVVQLNQRHNQRLEQIGSKLESDYREQISKQRRPTSPLEKTLAAELTQATADANALRGEQSEKSKQNRSKLAQLATRSDQSSLNKNGQTAQGPLQLGPGSGPSSGAGFSSSRGPSSSSQNGPTRPNYILEGGGPRTLVFPGAEAPQSPQ